MRLNTQQDASFHNRDSRALPFFKCHSLIASSHATCERATFAHQLLDFDHDQAGPSQRLIRREFQARKVEGVNVALHVVQIHGVSRDTRNV